MYITQISINEVKLKILEASNAWRATNNQSIGAIKDKFITVCVYNIY